MTKRISDALSRLDDVGIDALPVLHDFIGVPSFPYVLTIKAANTFQYRSGMILPSGMKPRPSIDGTLNASGDLLLSFADRKDALAFTSIATPTPPPSPAITRTMPTFAGTKPRLSAYSRGDTSWLSVRSWSNATKKADIAALKMAKRDCAQDIIELASDEMTSVLSRMFGKGSKEVCVTCVPCGHSRRSDCFGYRLAHAVADKLGFTFRKVFDDRFVTGVSHPKEFAKLPPLTMIERPSEPFTLLIDDVATSGWHMEEGLGFLRDQGLVSSGAVWIGGTVER